MFHVLCSRRGGGSELCRCPSVPLQRFPVERGRFGSVSVSARSALLRAWAGVCLCWRLTSCCRASGSSCPVPAGSSSVSVCPAVGGVWPTQVGSSAVTHWCQELAGSLAAVPVPVPTQGWGRQQPQPQPPGPSQPVAPGGLGRKSSMFWASLCPWGDAALLRIPFLVSQTC